MDKYSIDYAELHTDMTRPKFFKYAEVKDRLVRVAYDVVKFQDASEDIDGLWQIQSTDDGEVIVAMYEPPEGGGEAIKSESSWAVLPDKAASSMNVFYKGEPVHKIASTQVGVPEAELSDFCTSVANKLSENEDFRRSLLEDIPANERVALFSKYPELTE